MSVWGGHVHLDHSLVIVASDRMVAGTCAPSWDRHAWRTSHKLLLFPSSYRCGLRVPAQSQYLVPPGQAGCGAKGPSGESATRRSPWPPATERNLLEGSGTCAWRRRDSVSRMRAGAATRCSARARELLHGKSLATSV